MNLSRTLISLLPYLIFTMAFTIISCNNSPSKELTADQDQQAKPLNILWLVTEDMGHLIPTFGDSTITTPNLSRLAKEGIAFPNFFSTSGVCAPSRAAIATGMYPSSFGANHMRTTSYTEETGLPSYEAVPPPDARMVSEILRMNGYYCTNNFKQDYQFQAPMTAWDESGAYAHWRHREEDQPFFSIINFTDTHESGLFEPYGHKHVETRHYQSGDRSYKWPKEGKKEDINVHISQDTNFDVPPYLPDNAVVQRDMWKMYNNIAEMDQQVGAVLAQLEEDGLLENTIIFFYGDHGGPLPRQKRLIYDSGLNTPLIVRFPNQEKAGSFNHELVSFIDLAPTLLSLANISIPDHMHGQAFLGTAKADKERTYVHAAADRFDAITDAIRAVRNEKYKYIRNYRPQQAYYLPVEYRERIPTMKELLRQNDSGELDSIQSLWFRNTKSKEELYDCLNDPHEIHNLINDPKHQEALVELRAEMDRWLSSINDQPNLPEKELIAELWNGNSSQPVTADPTFSIAGSAYKILSPTEGASIGYQIISEDEEPPSSWVVYQNPINIPEGAKLRTKAHRIGYKASKILERDF